MKKIIVSEQSEDYQSGYRYGYSQGRRNKNKDFDVSTTETEDVIAWMPLPKPYKEEE